VWYVSGSIMKKGQASTTAVIVCAGRAVAHAANKVERFSDPTAFELLPDEARARVERLRSGAPPRGLRARVERAFLLGRSNMMIPRTVEIDDAIRAAASPQLVILGAGLDGRAWRMAELRDVTVFEVDHPDSQRDKRARASRLTAVAGDIRFVPVDFTCDPLDDALAKAGHDPARATTWVWEGVVMYLAQRDVDATLAVVEGRSAPRSRLIVTYHTPALLRRLLGFVVRRLGEPLRSAFTPDGMRALVAKHGFAVVKDDDIPTLAAALSADLPGTIRFMRHFRIATADRTP
jgi:methyltransferase (TIGR00027 family)